MRYTLVSGSRAAFLLDGKDVVASYYPRDGMFFRDTIMLLDSIPDAVEEVAFLYSLFDGCPA
jgi:hypothetical protein